MSKEQINDPNLKEGDRVTVTLTGEVVKHEPVEEGADDEIRVGDEVRLTGKDWVDYDLLGEIVTVEGIEWNEPQFHDSEGRLLAIFKDDHSDYSAEKVR